MSAFDLPGAKSVSSPFDVSSYSSLGARPLSSAEAAAFYQGEADSFIGKFGDWFGISDNAAQAAYYKTKANQQYETQATNSARAWDEYMASTQYQRAVKDLKAAGLNPWLALQSGISAQSGGHTAGSGSSARYVSEEKGNSKASITSLALLFVSCARLLAAL